MSAIRGILVERFGGPRALKYVTSIAHPSKPAAKQLLVRVSSAGVNPIDTYVRSGTHIIKPSLPFTPGFDGAGIVESIGKQVTKFKVGDRVSWCGTVDGSYKELTLTEEHSTFPLHEALSFQQGAAIGIPYLTAYRVFVSKAQLKAGETVLIHGASGATGMACCQVAKHLGAVVIGTAGTEEGMQAVLENGADRALNHREPDYIDKLKSEGGIDVVVEMLADVNLETDLQLAKKHGRIVVVGCRGKAEISPRIAMLNEITVFGLYMFHATQEEYVEMGDFMRKGQQEGWLRPVVGQEFALDRAADAHMEVIDRKTTHKGKIVLNV